MRYRLEGWYHVAPWSAEQRAAAQAREARQREALAKAGKPLPPPTDWAAATPRAYLRGDFYEWSPHTEKMLVEQTTTVATGAADWEHVVLDVTAPAWGPAFNIVFQSDFCTALLDDFALREVPPGG